MESNVSDWRNVCSRTIWMFIYELELWISWKSGSMRLKKKIQSNKQVVNQSYWETDDRNVTQWNRMKGQSVDAKYTYIISKPKKWKTEIIQSMLLNLKERMYAKKMFASLREGKYANSVSLEVFYVKIRNDNPSLRIFRFYSRFRAKKLTIWQSRLHYPKYIHKGRLQIAERD